MINAMKKMNLDNDVVSGARSNFERMVRKVSQRREHVNNHLSEEKLPATQRSGGKAFPVGELQELRLQVGTCLMCWGSRKQWDTGESVGDEIKWHGAFLRTWWTFGVSIQFTWREKKDKTHSSCPG